MSAYVRRSVLAALYAGITTTIVLPFNIGCSASSVSITRTHFWPGEYMRRSPKKSVRAGEPGSDVLRGQCLQMLRRIALDLRRAHDEFRVGHKLFHGAHVHLTGTQARRADRVLHVVTMREVVRAEIELFGRGRQNVSNRL